MNFTKSIAYLVTFSEFNKIQVNLCETKALLQSAPATGSHQMEGAKLTVIQKESIHYSYCTWDEWARRVGIIQHKMNRKIQRDGKAESKKTCIIDQPKRGITNKLKRREQANDRNMRRRKRSRKRQHRTIGKKGVAKDSTDTRWRRISARDQHPELPSITKLQSVGNIGSNIYTNKATI